MESAACSVQRPAACGRPHAAGRTLGLLGLLLCCLGRVGTASAHGFGQRYDLPVPLWLYVTGAAAAVVLSFVVVGVFVRGRRGQYTYPRLDLLQWPVGRLLAHPGCLFCLRLLAVGLFVLLILSGLFGHPHPGRNLAPTLVWVVWWVGLAYVATLGGNLWAVLNPWQLLFTWAEVLARRLTPVPELTLRLPYPRACGQWPGVLLLLAFAWIELVFADAAVPANLARLALVYSGLTWTGMVLFGPEVWLRYGEAFALVFGLLARFAPTEVRVVAPAVCRVCSLACCDQHGACINCYACFRRASRQEREWNLRPFAAGLLRQQAASTSEMVFILLLLATVTFDGLLATPLWGRIETTLLTLLADPGETPLTDVKTLGLVVLPLLFLGLYGGFCWLIAIVSGRRLSGSALAHAFVFTLVPIALAYHVAHYFSLLLIQGQFMIPLLSDPFGVGWDVLGTVAYRPNIGLVGARFAWFTAVIAIVAGHVIAVYLAHLVALRTLQEQAPALRSQYPMLVLMVGYTMLSLWILAQPIVEPGSTPPITAEAAASGRVDVPPDALLPEPGSGVWHTRGTGYTAAARLTYQALTSTFHDGTRMTVADLLYPYAFAYRWGTPGAPTYDPYVDRATALLREQLVGLRVLRVDRSEQGIGELKLVRETPVIEVYVNYAAADSAQVAALAPPWSSLPWHLLALMEAAVQQGWAAFSEAAAQHRGVPWLELVRSRDMHDRLASLVEDFAHRAYIPAALQALVGAAEARQRWAALRTFAQMYGHFLVSNGPYRLARWSADTVVLDVVRDISYPLGIGSYDRYAMPHRAYISQVEPHGQGLKIHAEVERVVKFQRTYEIVREPLGHTAPTGKAAELPLCRYVVLHPNGSIVHTGTASYTGNGVFFADLQGKLSPGLYTITLALYLSENYINPEIKTLTYRSR